MVKLISDRMLDELTQLYGLCFAGNSIADNMVGQLAVKFVMKNTAEIVHYNFAHEMPVIADILGDYAIERNAYLSRPVVPKHDEEYDNIGDMFKELLTYMMDLEKATIKVIRLAEMENDLMTKKMLDNFLIGLKGYTGMMLDFVDYIEANGDTPEQRMQMDSNINCFMNLPKFKMVEDDG